MWLLTGSAPLFTAWGIRVRAHAALLLLIGLTLLFSAGEGGMGFKNAVVFSTVLFGVVLLHEFGHCFAARRMGGDADEIIMGPLGGLAMVDAPQRPMPQFVTAVGGPLVNVAICLFCGILLWVLERTPSAVPWNPISPVFKLPTSGELAYYAWFVFIVSWGLLLFNLLPVFPLDGGRILQALLWPRMGYFNSMWMACGVGLVGSVLMVIWGVLSFGGWSGMVLILIGISCFLNCYMMRKMLRAEGPWAFTELDEEPLDPGYGQAKRSADLRKAAKLERARRRQAVLERREQARIDAILSKVSSRGMQSLTWRERRTLRRATAQQRKRDEARKKSPRHHGTR
jgi:Zn-dependent protease